ncbi:MAG: HEAT repeat domain-containing protein [Planctomycetota bacterium]|nr:HEAT repeat domain-containing protein [Planctomycetota bacterium]
MRKERANVLLGLLLVCALVIVVTGVLILLRPAKSPTKPETVAMSEPAAGETRPKEADAEDCELLAGMGSAKLCASFVRKSYFGPTRISQGGRTRTSVTEKFFLSIENRSKRAVQVSCPAYLFATLEGWKDPYGDTVKTPDFLYFFRTPAQPIIIDAGKTVETLLDGARYLGNAKRPAPSNGDVSTFLIKPVPDGSPYARFADELSATEPEPHGAHLVFSLIAGATPEDWLRQGILDCPYVEVEHLRAALGNAGLKEADHAFFAEAEKQYATVLESLQSGLDSGDVSHFGKAGAKCCKGSVEIARLAAKYLQPGNAPNGRDNLHYPFKMLEVDDKEVLDALFTYAMRDASEYNRIRAAVVGVELGDARAVPLVLQYMDHPERSDSDVRSAIAEGADALKIFWTLRAGQDSEARWKDAKTAFADFNLDSPELRGMTEAERNELEAFLASRANVRAGALEKLCHEALNGETPRVRRDAIRRLATSDAYKKERCAFDAVLDRMKNEQDSSVRREAICVLHEFGRVPESDVILIDILSRFAGKEIEKTEDRNLVGATLGAVRSQKSDEAIPVLLEYLDCSHIKFARDADEVLSHITGLKVKSGTRADWEAALEEK